MGFLERGASGLRDGSHLFRRLFCETTVRSCACACLCLPKGLHFQDISRENLRFLCPCSRSAQERQTLVQTDAVN